MLWIWLGISLAHDVDHTAITSRGMKIFLSIEYIGFMKLPVYFKQLFWLESSPPLCQGRSSLSTVITFITSPVFCFYRDLRQNRIIGNRIVDIRCLCHILWDKILSISEGNAYQWLGPYTFRLTLVCKVDKAKSDHLCWPSSRNGSSAPSSLFSKRNHSPRLSLYWVIITISSGDSWRDSWGGFVYSLSSFPAYRGLVWILKREIEPFFSP